MDVLHSSVQGALASAMCFRKSSISVLDEMFKVISPSDLDTVHPKLCPLPRVAAEEMVLSAVLLPILVSDIKMDFHPWIFATDASNSKGAVCGARLSESLLPPLWQAGDFKGGSVGLETWEHQLLHEIPGERGEGVCDTKYGQEDDPCNEHGGECTNPYF